MSDDNDNKKEDKGPDPYDFFKLSIEPEDDDKDGKKKGPKKKFPSGELCW